MTVNGHSTSNRHLVLTGKETLVVEDRPIPKCKPGHVLVKVMATGVCGSDLSFYSKGGIGTTVVKKPLVLGHESSGEVTEVGEGVNGLAVGDKVAIQPAFACGECRYCKSGTFNLCSDDVYLASPPTDGTMCQWYVCPAVNATKLPADITWKESGCIQPLAISVHLARRAGIRAHQTIAVFGCGPLGLLTMAVAKAYGAATIIAIDISETRVNFAKSYAATHGHLSRRRPAEEEVMQWNREEAARILEDAGLTRGLDLVIEASGAEPCMQLGVALLRHGGTFLQAGMGAPLASFPTLQVATKELNVLGTYRYSAGCFEDGVDLLQRGLVSLKPLITKTFPLDQPEDAFQAVKAGKEVKIVIMNQE